MDLVNKTCEPCKHWMPSLKGEKLKKYLLEVDENWKIYDMQSKIKREFVFEDFKRAIIFVNMVADLAESEGHHPNIYIYNWNKVRIELWTHKINGLHENDFILASKIDNLVMKNNL